MSNSGYETKSLELQPINEEIADCFQGIENQEAARFCQFEFFGGDEFILIVEPTTLQIHQFAPLGPSWGIFADSVPVNLEVYAHGILQMIEAGLVGSTDDFVRILKLEKQC